ncbi:MAG: DinB family protein [Pyrinomonadaceae bacterium]
MNFETIDDVYNINAEIRAALVAYLETLSEADFEKLSEKGDWTVTKVLEHLAMVEASMVRVCDKLLSNAEKEGKMAGAPLRLSDSFVEESRQVIAGGKKVEAPEIVQPSGNLDRSGVLDGLAASRKAFEELKPKFEKFDSMSQTFPHPAFGPITALDWLVLAGAHEARHLKQIQTMVGH